MTRIYQTLKSVVVIEQVDGLVFFSRLTDPKKNQTMLIDNRVIEHMVKEGAWIEITGDLNRANLDQSKEMFAVERMVLKRSVVNKGRSIPRVGDYAKDVPAKVLLNGCSVIGAIQNSIFLYQFFAFATRSCRKFFF